MKKRIWVSALSLLLAAALLCLPAGAATPGDFYSSTCGGEGDGSSLIEKDVSNFGLSSAIIHYSDTDSDTPGPSVVASPQSITVDGEPVSFEVYNIDGNNYFKLRDVAMVLSGTGSQFGVGYDEARSTISTVTGAPYTPIGGELAVGADNSETCVPGSQPMLVNGRTVSLTAYNIGGYNFFKLRELGETFGFEVGYDEDENRVSIISWTKTGSFVVEGGVYGVDYRFANRVLTVSTAKPLTLRNTDPHVPTANRIYIDNGVSANITLAGLNIDVSEKAGTAAFQIADESKGKVTVTLEEGSSNILKGGEGAAALQKNGGENSGRLTIDGSGALEAVAAGYTGTGSVCFGAGIGSSGAYLGNGETNCAHITIAGGNILAAGGGVSSSEESGCCAGAGIGSGGYRNASDITVSGGNIRAIGGVGSYNGSTGSASAAGIGGGGWGDCTGLTVSGGEVAALGEGDGPGLGGYHADGILITAGIVSAESKTGAGIGSAGGWGNSADVTITGGFVTASGSTGIGAAWQPTPSANFSRVLISGGFVTASSDRCAGIGGGENTKTVDITITGGMIRAQGADGSAAIGGSYNTFNVNEEITINIDGDCIIVANASLDGEISGTAVGSGVLIQQNSQTGEYEYRNGTEAGSTGWRGIVFRNGVGLMYGESFVLTESFALPEGSTLTIAPGQTLTVRQGYLLDATKGIIISFGTIDAWPGGFIGEISESSWYWWSA